MIRYIAWNTGDKAAAFAAAQERARKFHGIQELADLLAEYEGSRDVFPTLESFFPKIVEFFEGLTDRPDQNGFSPRIERGGRIPEQSSNITRRSVSG